MFEKISQARDSVLRARAAYRNWTDDESGVWRDGTQCTLRRKQMALGPYSFNLEKLRVVSLRVALLK